MRAFLLIVLVGFCLHADAQTFPSNLVIGEKIPEFNFNHVLLYPSSSISLSELKGKLIVLDYWATWCGSCINTFPKLDSLQKEFAKNVQFILIDNKKKTGEGKQTVEKFIKNRLASLRIIPDIPIVVEDTITQFYFPHQYIPHYVWIDPNGKLLAVTGTEFVTRDVIICLLHYLADRKKSNVVD